MSPTSIVTFLEVIDYRKQPDFIIRIFSRTNVVVFLMIYYFCVLVFSKGNISYYGLEIWLVKCRIPSL